MILTFTNPIILYFFRIAINTGQAMNYSTDSLTLSNVEIDNQDFSCQTWQAADFSNVNFR